MKTKIEAFDEAVMRSNLEELRKQLAEAMAENHRLRSLVKSVPTLITQARIDAKNGVSTQIAKEFYL